MIDNPYNFVGTEDGRRSRKFFWQRVVWSIFATCLLHQTSSVTLDNNNNKNNGNGVGGVGWGRA